MLPKIPVNSQEPENVKRGINSATIHDFEARKKAQLRQEALKRVKAAAKNLSW